MKETIMAKFRITELDVITNGCDSGSEYYTRIKCNNGDAYWELRGINTDHPDTATLSALDVFTGHAGSWSLRGTRCTPPVPVKVFCEITVIGADDDRFCAHLTCKVSGEMRDLRCYDACPARAVFDVCAMYNRPVAEWWGGN